MADNTNTSWDRLPGTSDPKLKKIDRLAEKEGLSSPKKHREITPAYLGRNLVGNYASVNGLKLYYEIYGTGTPLVLLHGGVGASEMFEPVLPKLAESRQVITVHLQTHGWTADIDRPLRFESMADDIAELIKHLGIEKADIMGYSLGGGVSLQTVIRHPNLIRKLVVISTPVKRDGWYPEVLESMAQMGPDTAKTMKETPLYQLYPETDWELLFIKIGDLLRQDYDWSKDAAVIKSPIMLIFADADAVRTAHIMEFFTLLGGGQRDAGLDGSLRPNAQLAILPGTTHYNILSFPELAALITAFLDSLKPEPM
ncbi:MAG TPA: alpha/beta hydrolase [Methanosarcina sp.]|jgi:pimeloyl-ACP methyl ester carboxylesterase|nr:alpha/beta hydrolase [Methanosarcina sp.]